MKIELHLYASLTKYLPPDAESKSLILDIDAGATIKDVIEQMNVPEKSVKLIFVNGVHADVSKMLKNGDRVGIFPPVGGG